MRFPVLSLLLTGLCASLPSAYAERGTNCVPTKAQLILREKMAELDQTPSQTSPAPVVTPSGMTPEQEAKAREALQQQLATTPPPSTAPAAVVVAPVVVPVATTSSTEETEPEETAPATRSGMTPEQEARAREALRQQLAATPPPSPAPAPIVVAPVVVAPVVVPVVPPESETEQPALTPEQEALARAALRQKLAQVETTPIVQVEPAPAPTLAPVPVSVAAPMPASEKQGLERLAELTDQYKSGLITPYEYHSERAEIVKSLKP